MSNKIWGRFLPSVGIILIFIALFSDIFRGRPYFLGRTQVTVLIIGIIVFILSMCFKYYKPEAKKIVILIFALLHSLVQFFSTVVGKLNNYIRVRTENFVTYLNKKSIYPSTVWKIVNLILFLWIFGLLIREATNMLSSPSIDPWRIGDWLINYQGGFVRRGFVGEILLYFSRILGIPLIPLVVILQICLYLIFFIFTYRLVIISSFNPLMVTLIYSPAFMLFLVNNNNIGSNFRKEIFFLAFFSCLCHYVVNHKSKIPTYVFIIISIVTSAIVLSHEMLLAYLPYVFCVLLLHEEVLKRKWKLVIVFIPAFIITVLIFFFGQASTKIVIDICNSLLESAPENCHKAGAFAFLSQDINSALRFVQKEMIFERKSVYALCALLSFIPILLFYFSRPIKEYFKMNHISQWFVVGILSAVISSLPLFWVAIDYGRFIFIHIASLSLLALVLNSKVKKGHGKFGLKWMFGLLCSFILILSWRMLHWGLAFTTAFPIVNYFQSIMR